MTETENNFFFFYMHSGLLISAEIGLFLLLVIILPSYLGYAILKHYRYSSGMGDEMTVHQSLRKYKRSMHLLRLLVKLHYFE